MFVDADVIVTNQSWMLSVEASVSHPRGWPEERDALMSFLITQQVTSQPLLRVCVVSWRPWPPPWCAQPGISLSAAGGAQPRLSLSPGGAQHRDALPQLPRGVMAIHLGRKHMVGP